MEVRQAAAVNFKNHVKRYWAPGRDARSLGDGVDPAMPDAEKVTCSACSSLFFAAAEVLRSGKIRSTSIKLLIQY